MSRWQIHEVTTDADGVDCYIKRGDIVRCKECKYASDNKVYGCMLNHFNDNNYHRMYADDFCSYGEREGE